MSSIIVSDPAVSAPEIAAPEACPHCGHVAEVKRPRGRPKRIGPPSPHLKEEKARKRKIRDLGEKAKRTEARLLAIKMKSEELNISLEAARRERKDMARAAKAAKAETPKASVVVIKRKARSSLPAEISA